MIQQQSIKPQPKLLERLGGALGVQAGEGTRFSLLLGQSFLMGVALITYYVSANALFLSHFSAQNLPYVYIVAALALMTLGLGFSRLQSRLPLRVLLVGNLGLLLTVVVGLRLLLSWAGAGRVYFAMMVSVRVLWALGNLGLWALAGRLFTVRQGKRLFSLITAGAVFGVVFAGLLNGQLIGWLGIQNLAWITTASLLACCWLLVITVRRFNEAIGALPADAAQGGAHRAPAAESQAAGATSKAKKGWFKSEASQGYVRAIFFYTILSTISTYVLDYAFVGQVSARFSETEAIGNFFGNYMGIATFCTLLFVILVANRILRRYGVRGGLLADPLSVGAGALAIVLISTLQGSALLPGAEIVFWLVAATKLADDVTVVAMTNTSVRIMYQPLPKEERTLAQSVVESLISPFSMGIAGAMLLVFAALGDLTPMQAIYLLLAIWVGWLGTAIFLGRQYYGALRRALAKRFIISAAEQEPVAFDDPASLAVLEKHLGSENPGDALFAVEMLAEFSPEALEAVLIDLLAHPHPEVRIAAIQHLDLEAENSFQLLAQAVEQEKQAQGARAAALEAIGLIGTSQALAYLEAHLDDSDPQCRRGAVAGLLQSGALEGILTAGDVLREAQNSPTVEARCFAASVIGQVGNTGFYRSLLPMLHDESLLVRRQALMACGRVGHPALWPLVIEALRSQETRQAARQALLAGGEGALPALAHALADEQTTAQVVRDLARLCGQMSNEQVNQALRKLIAYPDERTRSEILHILFRSRQAVHQASPQDKAGAAGIVRQMQAEAGVLAQTAGTAAALEAHSCAAARPLQSALDQISARGQLRVLDLLALLVDAGAIAQIRESIEGRPSRSGQEEQRANALEMLDVLLSKELPELRSLVMALVGCSSVKELAGKLSKLGEAKSAVSQAEANARSAQPDKDLEARLLDCFYQGNPLMTNHWLAACALFAGAELFPPAFQPASMEAVKHPDMVVRETALGVLAHSYASEPEVRGILEAVSGVGAQAKYIRQMVASYGVEGKAPMLLTIEKVMILKSVGIFSETSDDVLAELARYLEEVQVAAGETIFEKGDFGDSLYIIASGKARVHAGELTLNILESRDVFGEMALLDPAPRLASVTAMEHTHLLRLGKEPFFEAVDSCSEIAHGVIQVLSRRLRDQAEEAGRLDSELRAIQRNKAG